MMSDTPPCTELAATLNRECTCVSVDHDALGAALETASGPAAAWLAARPHLFSDTRVYVGERHVAAMAAFVAAVERVVALPAYVERALAWAPLSARRAPGNPGVFLGYDFHIGAAGPRLIEINTNAGGALLNTRLLRAQRACAEGSLPPGVAVAQPPDPGAVEAAIVDMFRAEWRLAGGTGPLRRLAIVDEDPDTQYLAPEFALFRELFAASGIAATITDPRALTWTEGRLLLDGAPVDLVYNRLTDFALEAPAHAALAAAWAAGGVAVTPHPRAHALYADKRNLTLLGDDAWLETIGVDAPTRAALAACLPHTIAVRAADADTLWRERRRWFFKPAAGFGSRAAYRGDKLTRRVFEEILAGDYIAQEYVPPSERRLVIDGIPQNLKLDLRNYAWQGEVQLLTARLYQGQTTNFRTPGGGFAAVFPVRGPAPRPAEDSDIP